MFRPKINDVNIYMYVPFCQTNGIWRRFQKPTTPKPTQKPTLDRMGLSEGEWKRANEHLEVVRKRKMQEQ